MSTVVVNKYSWDKDGTSQYIGRVAGSDQHYGNPFTHLEGTIALVRVESRAESIKAFHSWLAGTDFNWLEPGRRQWILDHLNDLRNKTLICFCKPQACHGDVYVSLLES